MTKARAQAAVDDAFSDSVKHLFEVLVSNLMLAQPDAEGKFHAGMVHRDEAYGIASRQIETIFPE